MAHSKTWRRFVVPFCILAALLANVKSLEAQATTPVNRVLELEGTNSYVELPSNIFNDLTEATVEGWVKWKTPGRWTRFFDFGKQAQTMWLGREDTSDNLVFEDRKSVV